MSPDFFIFPLSPILPETLIASNPGDKYSPVGLLPINALAVYPSSLSTRPCRNYDHRNHPALARDEPLNF